MMKWQDEGQAVPFSIEGYPFLCRQCGARGTFEEDDEFSGWGHAGSIVNLLFICPKCAFLQDYGIETGRMSKWVRQGFDAWLQERFF
jgi:hypothetical protein